MPQVQISNAAYRLRVDDTLRGAADTLRISGSVAASANAAASAAGKISRPAAAHAASRPAARGGGKHGLRGPLDFSAHAGAKLPAALRPLR